MKKPVKKKEVTLADPLTVFNHAYHISAADRYIRDMTGTLEHESQARASMILSAFGIELFFKCLILIDNRMPPPTHRLDVLFRQLHHKHKRLVEREWETNPRGRGDVESFAKQFDHPADLPNAIIRCAGAFEKMRYHYEEGGTFYLQALPSLLINVILVEIKPEWKTPPPIQPTSPVR